MKIISDSDADWIVGKGELNYKKKVRLAGVSNAVNVIQDVIIPPNGTVPSHHHKQTSEIFYIIEGEPILITDGKETVLKQRDVVIVEAGEEHGFRNESTKKVFFLVLKINFVEGDAVLY